jgi:hypothetical protein
MTETLSEAKQSLARCVTCDATLRVTGFQDFVHCVVISVTGRQCFGNWICFLRPRVEKATPSL